MKHGDERDILGGSLSEHLYNTSTLPELDAKLTAGPTQEELRQFHLTEKAWSEQVALAKRAIERD